MEIVVQSQALANGLSVVIISLIILALTGLLLVGLSCAEPEPPNEITRGDIEQE
jgi:hypothetical protein